MRFLVMLLVALAGCTGLPADEIVLADAPASEPPLAEGTDAAPRDAPEPIPRQSAEPPFAEALHRAWDEAAELHVPKGEFHLVHLVANASTWQAPGHLILQWRVEGEGMLMHALTRWTLEKDRVEAWPSFGPAEGEGRLPLWAWRCEVAFCAGHGPWEAAVLIGSHAGPAVLRIGHAATEDADLWARPSFRVEPDAVTRSAFWGTAHRMAGSDEATSQQGIMRMEQEGTPLAASAALERTTRFHAAAEASQPGILVYSWSAQDAVGADTWAYRLQATGVSEEDSGSGAAAQGWAGQWPRVHGMRTLGPGPVEFEATRSFTGIGAAVTQSHEWATIGHAGIDLATLFGWDLDWAN